MATQGRAALLLGEALCAMAAQAVLIIDTRRRVLDVNQAFSRLTGHGRPDVIGREVRMLLSGRHDAAFFLAVWNTIRHGELWHGELWLRRSNGELLPRLASICCVRDAGGRLRQIVAMLDLADVAHGGHDSAVRFDALTGIANQRQFRDRQEQAVAEARRRGGAIAVCCLDLDDFKAINDAFGRETGDLVLVRVAAALGKLLGADDVAARIGGDTFALLFHDLPQDATLATLARRVLDAVRTPIDLDSAVLRLSASLGLTRWPLDSDDSEILLHHAHKAMYAAKSAGGNIGHCFDPDTDRARQSRRAQLARFEDALAGGELVLHYQPMVDMFNGRITGVEALLRWRHPSRGLLAPAQFLQVVDGSDVEVTLGEWVIATALRQAAQWAEDGFRTVVGVNISARHLLAEGFVPQLHALLQAQPQLDVAQLELEILETTALADVAKAGRVLAACRDLGVRFALDDFGTGYASLAYFRTLPVDLLKIDQLFVRDMLDDGNDRDIVESVVRLAQAFNRACVAEGVETEAHAALLALLGCRHAQGYGIARPMPAAQVVGWARQWSARRAWVGLSAHLARDDAALLCAVAVHRRWVRRVEQWLEDGAAESGPAPSSLPLQAFGQWCEGVGRGRFGTLAAFAQAERAYAALRAAGDALLRVGHGPALARVPELRAARDALEHAVQALLRAIRLRGADGPDLRPSGGGDQPSTPYSAR